MRVRIRKARELTACKMRRRHESSCECVAGEAHLIRAGVSGAREPVHGEHLVRTRAASVRVQHSQRVHGASVARFGRAPVQLERLRDTMYAKLKPVLLQSSLLVSCVFLLQSNSLQMCALVAHGMK